MSERVAFTILGEPASKANSRQLVTFGRGENKRPALIKSEKAREYEKAAQLQIPASARVMLAGPVKVTLRIYYASERPDLDESVVLDVLQAKFDKGVDGDRLLVRAGVYRNDRQVREKHVFHAIDRNNPRTDVVVEPLVPGLFDEMPAIAPRAPCRCEACKVRLHASDCAVHNAPAYPAGRCSCGADPKWRPPPPALLPGEVAF